MLEARKHDKLCRVTSINLSFRLERYGASPRLVRLGRKWSIMYYVYVIKSSRDGRLYKGFTSNITNRIKEHNLGEVSSTRVFCPWELVYYEAFLSIKDVRREELFLKSGKGRERLKYLLTEI